MIKTENIFDDFDNMSGLWVDDAVSEGTDLARISDFIITKNIPVISVPDGITEKIWPWIENCNVRIFNRFRIESGENFDVVVSNVARQINDGFCHGATGAMVITSPKDLEPFVDAIYPIKDDLFFDRDLVMGIDIDKVDSSNWKNIFSTLNRIGANAILLTAMGDNFDASSDFIGRVYAMFTNWNFNGALYLMFGKNMLRYSQVLRLAQKMCVAVSDKIIAFLKY